MGVGRLSLGAPPSDLDPVLELLGPAPSGTVIASNDNADGTTLEALLQAIPIPENGTYYLRVTGSEERP